MLWILKTEYEKRHIHKKQLLLHKEAVWNVVIADRSPGNPQESLDPSNHFDHSTASR